MKCARMLQYIASTKVITSGCNPFLWSRRSPSDVLLCWVGFSLTPMALFVVVPLPNMVVSSVTVKEIGSEDFTNTLEFVIVLLLNFGVCLPV